MFGKEEEWNERMKGKSKGAEVREPSRKYYLKLPDVARDKLDHRLNQLSRRWMWGRWKGKDETDAQQEMDVLRVVSSKLAGMCRAKDTEV